MGKVLGMSFVKNHSDELRRFLDEAQQDCYKHKSVIKGSKNKDGSTRTTYKRDDWRYVDTFFGGEPYRGASEVYYKGVICYVMHYKGEASPDANEEEIYDNCLMPALMAADPDNPWRGRKHYYTASGFYYKNDWEGDIESVEGEERIYAPDGRQHYYGKYSGGIVNLR